LFFPTRTARFYDYENWKIIDALKDKIEWGYLQVFCVDSVDIESFYSSHHPAKRIERHLQYESYIINEVIPYIRCKNKCTGLVSAGCSLGGYHAVNLAFKHPHSRRSYALCCGGRKTDQAMRIAFLAVLEIRPGLGYTDAPCRPKKNK